MSTIKKGLKVLHLAQWISSSGDFARRLQDELIKHGIDSNILSLHTELPDSTRLKSMDKKARFKARIDNKLQGILLRKQKQEYGMFSHPILGNNIAGIEQVQEADVIYVHWILNGYLGLESIRKLAELRKPMVFILHDMWTITGGCHHSFECDKYKTGCYSCHMFITTKKRDLSYRQFRKKRDLFTSYDNLYFVAPSKWLYHCALESGVIKSKPVFHIPNVLDQNFFKPMNKQVARQRLNIPMDRPVISFGAISITSPYKGWEYLKSAIGQIHKENRLHDALVLIFGGAHNQEIAKSIPYETRLMGHVNDEQVMVLIYNAADVFIAPSLADNLPYTVFEALSCGTPVVGFKTGGIPDLIDHKKNGYLAKYKNVPDLVEGIHYCFENDINGYVLKEMQSQTSLQKHLALLQLIANSSQE